MANEFKLGQAVVVTRDTWGKDIEGEIGIVVDIPGGDMVGIEFFKNIGGHDCDGKAKDDYGWNVKREDVEPYIMRVGDRVELFDGPDSRLFGKGAVIKYRSPGDSTSVVVEFDEYMDGHSGHAGECKDGHGWYVRDFNLKLIKPVTTNIKDSGEDKVKKEIKVGDIVEYIGGNDSLVGKRGKVVKETVKSVTVCFEDFDGHDADGLCPDGGGWFCNKDRVRLVEAKGKFKVGDKVKMISEHPRHGMGSIRTGDIGTVKEVSGLDGKLGKLSVDFERQHSWIGDLDEFELVTEVKPVKKGLEVGDIVVGLEEANKHYTLTREGVYCEVTKVAGNYIGAKILGDDVPGSGKNFDVQKSCFGFVANGSEKNKELAGRINKIQADFKRAERALKTAEELKGQFEAVKEKVKPEDLLAEELAKLSSREAPIFHQNHKTTVCVITKMCGGDKIGISTRKDGDTYNEAVGKLYALYRALGKDTDKLTKELF